MTTPNLAKIERVDLREAWPNEARDFTPWLAENIAELGEALGMDLELQRTEASVGDYSLDVLATDLNQNRPVIIENQLERTNHDHLGKLLTYAAGYNANVIVWLTREFRDEHRAALDWLNQRTAEETHFFGVAVELYRIGDSHLAPHFNLVVMPNDWQKRNTRRSASEAQTDSEQAAFERRFSGSLQKVLIEHGFVPSGNSIPRRYVNFRSGAGQYIAYGAHLLVGQNRVRTELSFYSRDRERNVRLLEGLLESKEEIESEFGQSLTWTTMAKDCRIALERPGSIRDEEDAQSEMRDWMLQTLLKLRQVFEPRLNDLVSQEPHTQEQTTLE